MKKFLSILMVLTLVLSFGMIASAEENTGSITITNATINDSYSLYKIFDATYSKDANGNADAALRLLIADKLEDLMRVQVDAIKNIKIDKVTVWDSGANGDGKSATAGFLSGMMKSVPPLEEVFALAGMQLPDMLGKKIDEPSAAVENAEVIPKAEASQPIVVNE